MDKVRMHQRRKSWEVVAKNLMLIRDKWGHYTLNQLAQYYFEGKQTKDKLRIPLLLLLWLHPDQSDESWLRITQEVFSYSADKKFPNTEYILSTTKELLNYSSSDNFNGTDGKPLGLFLGSEQRLYQFLSGELACSQTLTYQDKPLFIPRLGYSYYKNNINWLKGEPINPYSYYRYCEKQWHAQIKALDYLSKNFVIKEKIAEYILLIKEYFKAVISCLKEEQQDTAIRQHCQTVQQIMQDPTIHPVLIRCWNEVVAEKKIKVIDNQVSTDIEIIFDLNAPDSLKNLQNLIEQGLDPNTGLETAEKLPLLNYLIVYFQYINQPLEEKLKFISYLISKGSDVNYLPVSGITAIDQCLVDFYAKPFNDYVQLINLLLEAGAQPDKSIEPSLCLYFGLVLGTNEHFTDNFERLKSNENCFKIFKQTAKALIEKGANVNAVSNNGLYNPLLMSVAVPAIRLTRFLLRDTDVIINIQNIDGQSPLFLSVKTGGDFFLGGGKGVKIANLLIKYGADIFIEDKNKQNILRFLLNKKNEKPFYVNQAAALYSAFIRYKLEDNTLLDRLGVTDDEKKLLLSIFSS